MNKDSEIFLPQTNGEISDSIVQNWTLQAYESAVTAVFAQLTDQNILLSAKCQK